MTDGPLSAEHLAQALLGLLATLMPETVEFKVSGYLVFGSLVALWIWRR